MSDELPESPESVAQSQRQTVVLMAVLVEGGLLAGASFLGWMIDRPPLRHFAWTPRAVLWGVAATVPIALLFFLFLAGRSALSSASRSLVRTSSALYSLLAR